MHTPGLGAIPFVLTNVPQTIVTVASNNPIYGETTHPMDENRSSGGSSAGDGASIACGGSIVGIGGDVAASIRVPAHACGIAGMKVSTLRPVLHVHHSSYPARMLMGEGHALLGWEM